MQLPGDGEVPEVLVQTVADQEQQQRWPVLPKLVGLSEGEMLGVAYRHPDRKQGQALLTRLIASLSRGVPAALSELVKLGRT